MTSYLLGRNHLDRARHWQRGRWVFSRPSRILRYMQVADCFTTTSMPLLPITITITSTELPQARIAPGDQSRSAELADTLDRGTIKVRARDGVSTLGHTKQHPLLLTLSNPRIGRGMAGLTSPRRVASRRSGGMLQYVVVLRSTYVEGEGGCLTLISSYLERRSWMR